MSSEVKDIMDNLGRTKHDSDIAGSHLGKILTYLQMKKEEALRTTINKIGLICGIHPRYVREGYINGLIDFGIIEVEIKTNIEIWHWIGISAFNNITPSEQSALEYMRQQQEKRKHDSTNESKTESEKT